MPCVNADGTVTPSAKAILAALVKGADAEQIATATDLPLFRVRSALRELAEAGLVESGDSRYALTEAGRKQI
jgi:predicted methyltransferase